MTAVTSPELSIGAFARLVGLTPSALRFYDDCGLLPPSRVDPVTGYRWYAASREPRARLLALLRVVDFPLASARTVLDGPAEAGARLLKEHLAAVEDKTMRTRRAVARALACVHGGRCCRVRLPGPELASAVRQVAPAVAAAGRLTPAGEDPALDEVLTCVLLEVDDAEVRLVASDRYQLSVRSLQPRHTEGTPGRALVPIDEMVGLAAWSAPQDTVTLTLEGRGIRAEAHTDACSLPIREGDYPAYQSIVQQLPPPTTRVLLTRAPLREALCDGDLTEVIALTLRSEGAWLDPPGMRMEGIVTGDPLRVGFSRELLLAVLDAGVGPELLLELSEPDQPVLVRSADQGTFTTLVMPCRLDPPQ